MAFSFEMCQRKKILFESFRFDHLFQIQLQSRILSVFQISYIKNGAKFSTSQTKFKT